MQQEYNNENRGVLFLKQDKESERHPDYTGEINIQGTDFFLSAWKKVSKNGNGYLSLSVTPKEKAGNQQKAAQKPQDMTPQQQGSYVSDTPVEDQEYVDHMNSDLNIPF